MQIRSPTFQVRAHGPYACFTRPELKTERVSYEVMTPSAARGILDAILWKPAIRWQVERIHVLAPIRFESVKRNEVTGKASLRGNPDWYFADEDRTQRNSVLLRDVDYVIDAHFCMTPKAGPGDNLAKFIDMFSRRLERGQCFTQPYFGCREMAAAVEPAPERWNVPDDLQGERRLGMMLQDLAYVDGGPRPFFFDASLKNGTLQIPEVTP